MLGRILSPACAKEKIVPPLAILLRDVGEVAIADAEIAGQRNRREQGVACPRAGSFEKVGGLLFGEVT